MINLAIGVEYPKQNSIIFISEGQTLTICQRKKPDLIKPKYYLLASVNNKRFYFSSLYKTEKEGIYSIEYNKKYYYVDLLNTSKVTFTYQYKPNLG